MRSDIDVVELLDLAQRALSERLSPSLTANDRYVVAMAASAVRMAARALSQLDVLDAADDALAEAAGTVRVDAGVEWSPPGAVAATIRMGAADGLPEVHHALWANAVAHASVSKPSSLTRVERQIAGLPTEVME